MTVQACLNGMRPADTPMLPLSPAAIAADAAACMAAGASSVHLHPRDAQARESLLPSDVAAVLAAVRRAVPGLGVGLSTGDWIAPRLGRLEDMRGWTERPDFVSVNLSEPDAPEVMRLMRAMGVGVELGLASVADVERLLSLPDEPGQGALRAMIEIDIPDPVAARDRAARMRSMLDHSLPDVPLLLHGFDATAWDFVALARDWGCQTRIGLEDVLHLPDGEPAANAALVAMAVRVMGR